MECIRSYAYSIFNIGTPSFSTITLFILCIIIIYYECTITYFADIFTPTLRSMMVKQWKYHSFYV